MQEINNLEFNIWCYNKFTNSAKVFKAKYPPGMSQKIESVILPGTESLLDPQKLRYEWGTTPFSFAKSSFDIAIFVSLINPFNFESLVIFPFLSKLRFISAIR